MEASVIKENELVMLLIEKFQNGDSNAFSRLYEMYVQPLYFFGCNLTSDHELLKDCIQDVFIKIFQKKDDLHTVKNLKTYLYISLKNKIYDEMRRVSVMSESEPQDLSLNFLEETVEENYVKNEMKEKETSLLTRLLSYLSNRQRKAIELYYIEGKDYDEICEILNMNYQSVRNLVYRGMQKMRSSFDIVAIV